MQSCWCQTNRFFGYFTGRWRKRKEVIEYETNEPERTVTEQPSSSIASAFTVCKSRPKLDELVKGYDLFLLAQRSLFTMKHPELGMEEQFIRPKKKYLSKMEVDSIPLVLNLFNNHFGIPFKKLGKQQKVDLVINAFDDFSLFNKAYLTCKFFPNIEDDRIAHTQGYYTATTQIDPEWFFEGYVVVDRIHEYIQIIEPIRMKMLRSVNKARQLKARKIDFLAFMFLALWKHVEYANLLTDEMTTYKEELLKEWMDSLRDDYGEDSVKRFAQLMIFYYESDDLALELVKSKMVLRVYLLRKGRRRLVRHSGAHEKTQFDRRR
ncbi:hypothetical protein M3Y97_00011600 [Aphelenchoides bicaudatus]|nr:hypothetical protein M3Y97_00011600 [Aphelenchoides bicaudatus]